MIQPVIYPEWCCRVFRNVKLLRELYPSNLVPMIINKFYNI